MKKSVLSLLVSLLTTIALLTACGGGGSTGTPSGGQTPGTAATPATGGATAPTPADSGTTGGGDARSIVDESLVAMAEVENYHATIDMSFSGSQSGEVSLEVYQKGSLVGTTGTDRPQFKGIVIKSTVVSLPEKTTVVYGTTSCMYDPVQNVVVQATDGKSIGNSELYNLFLGSQVRVTALFSEKIADPSVAGEEKVGSFDTTKITLTPKEAASRALAPGAKGTVWIDKATNIPVQLDYSEDGFGTKWTVTSLSTEALGDEPFASCGAPAEATTVQASEVGKVVKVDSMEAATTEAGFTPLLPGYLPDGLPTDPSGIGVQATPLGPIITLTYATSKEATPGTEFPGMEDVKAREGTSITIRAFKGTVALPTSLPGTASSVTVRGQQGTLEVAGEDQATLSWQEDGVVYTITASGYGESEVTKVAEGLK